MRLSPIFHLIPPRFLDVLIPYLKTVSYSYEIIVVDDGSKDKTVDVVQSYVRTHGTDMIRYVSQLITLSLSHVLNSFSENLYHCNHMCHMTMTYLLSALNANISNKLYTYLFPLLGV